MKISKTIQISKNATISNSKKDIKDNLKPKKVKGIFKISKQTEKIFSIKKPHKTHLIMPTITIKPIAVPIKVII